MTTQSPLPSTLTSAALSPSAPPARAAHCTLPALLSRATSTSSLPAELRLTEPRVVASMKEPAT